MKKKNVYIYAYIPYSRHVCRRKALNTTFSGQCIFSTLLNFCGPDAGKIYHWLRWPKRQTLVKVKNNTRTFGMDSSGLWIWVLSGLRSEEPYGQTQTNSMLNAEIYWCLDDERCCLDMCRNQFFAAINWKHFVTGVNVVCHHFAWFRFSTPKNSRRKWEFLCFIATKKGEIEMLGGKNEQNIEREKLCLSKMGLLSCEQLPVNSLN